jgi:hypothetical protein
MNVFVIVALFAVFFLIVVTDLMRRRVLMEQYSLFWLGMGIVLLILSVFHQWLNPLADLLHIAYPPSLLFLIGFLFLFGIMLHLTVVLTRLTLRSIRLVQELGMTKAEMVQMQEKIMFLEGNQHDNKTIERA